MQTFRMNASFLPTLLEPLKQWGTLVAPVKRGAGTFVLAAIDDVSLARPDAQRTILPFKKLLLQPRFTMLERRDGEPPHEVFDNDLGPIVYFGALACDIHALEIFDLIYMTDCIDP